LGLVADRLVVADTDLIVDFLRNREPGASTVVHLVQTGMLRITAISAFELRLGADFLRRREPIEALLSGRTLPLDLLGALHAGRISSTLRSEGRPIDVRDALLAGVCLRFSLPLATRNTRHFYRVPGLELATGSPPAV
jgi:tRNA(fMet)-specific endonuclease VapC